MAGLRIEGNTTGNVAEVNTSNELKVVTSLDADTAGMMGVVAEINATGDGAGRLVRPLDASVDYRLRVGMDGLLFADTFSHGQLNVSKYKIVNTTATTAMSGGRLVLNNGNSVTAAQGTQVQTWQAYKLQLSYGIYADFSLLFSQDPVANAVSEFGLGLATGVATPLDGIFFRLSASGVMLGVINNNGSETSVALTGFLPQANILNHYLIIAHNDRTEFWVDDVLYGSITTPNALGSPTLSTSLPLLMRQYNANTTSVAQRMEVANVSVTSADMDRGRLWPTTMAAMGQSSINIPDGVAAGYTANYANTAAPASATLSNTAAGYTTLGGQFQFAAVAGAETDYALFAYQVPAGSATVPGKSLILRGLRIETYNTGAAVATSATLLQWGLGVGSSAVSLATADSATAGGRSPRRLTLGVQSFPIGAAIGALAAPIDINLDAPVVAEAGTFVHVILKMPLGTATASQVVRGTCLINGYFE